MVEFSQTPAYLSQRCKDGEIFIGSFIPNGMTTAVDASHSYICRDGGGITFFLRFSEVVVITMLLEEVMKIKYSSEHPEDNLFVVALNERLQLTDNHQN